MYIRAPPRRVDGLQVRHKFGNFVAFLCRVGYDHNLYIDKFSTLIARELSPSGCGRIFIKCFFIVAL